NFELELAGKPIALAVSPRVSWPPRFEPFSGHHQLPEVVQRKVFTTPPLISGNGLNYEQVYHPSEA
ncbi:hypothetical protein, partial [Rhodopirellula baltica]